MKLPVHDGRSLRSAAFWLASGLLWLAPLPLASNRSWAVGLLAIGFALAWGLAWAGRAAKIASAGAAVPWLPRRSAWPHACLAGLLALLAGQWALGWADAGNLFALKHHLLRTALYAMAFSALVLCVDTAARARQLLGVLLAAGVLQAALAVALWAGGGHYWYLFTDFQQGQRATGTFVNPDHLAGYMELCLAAGLGLMLAQMGGDEQASARGWQQSLLSTLRFALSPKMLVRLLLVVMVVALVMSHSRMGNAAFFAAMLLVGLGVAARSQRLRRPALVLVASMALVDIIIIGQWVGLDRLVQRIEGTVQSSSQQAAAANAGLDAAGLSTIVAQAQHEESIQERLRIPTLSLPLVAQRPWLGHGGGQYEQLLPQIKPPGFPHHWTHAHNDYLQMAVDTGLLGLGLVLLWAAGTAWRAGRMIDDTQPRLKRGVGAAVWLALCSLGLHALVDFNLHITANALTLSALMALAWAGTSPGAWADAATAGRSR